jgi:hypothetical protein
MKAAMEKTTDIQAIKAVVVSWVEKKGGEGKFKEFKA